MSEADCGKDRFPPFTHVLLFMVSEDCELLLLGMIKCKLSKLAFFLTKKNLGKIPVLHVTH